VRKVFLSFYSYDRSRHEVTLALEYTGSLSATKFATIGNFLPSILSLFVRVNLPQSTKYMTDLHVIVFHLAENSPRGLVFFGTVLRKNATKNFTYCTVKSI
jgi:hypothetical protein